MAKTHSPLWAPRAFGSIGESAVYRWCGSEGSGVFRRERDYVQLERYYVTANPRTEDQQAWRGSFTSAVSDWQALPEVSKQVWNYYQDHRLKYPIMSGYNLFISRFLLSGGHPEIPPGD